MPYVTMHKTLKCINKNPHKFIKRPVLMNSHKFVMHIKMLFIRYYNGEKDKPNANINIHIFCLYLIFFPTQ